MIYVGNFCFNQKSRQQEFARAEPWHGFITCMTEANAIEEALEKLKKLLRKLHKYNDLFENVCEIYLDSCVEIRSVPRGGLLVHFSLKEGEDLGGISTSVRGANEKQAVAYHIGTNEENDGKLQEIEPFVSFNRLRRGSR